MADEKEPIIEPQAEPQTEAQTAVETPQEEAPKSTEQLLAEAQAEIENLKTQALYKAAEFDNYRKRVLQEKADLILNGGQKVIEALLPVVDDMERAIESTQTSDDAAAIREGVDLIYQKLQTMLKGQGVQPIPTKDQDFNTDRHEAIAQIPAPTPEQKGKVIDCTKKGYTMGTKVIRYAQVVVGV